MSTHASRSCYYPSGLLAEGDVPCSSDEYSSCCGQNDLCLDNGLCLSVAYQPYQLSRGSCTNQNWDQGCPEYCGDKNRSGGCLITTLTIVDYVPYYCCGVPIVYDNTLICPDGDESFTVIDGNPIVGYAMLANVSSLAASTTTTTTTSSSSVNQTCNSTIATETVSPDSRNSSKGHEVAVGAGVGVPLGVIALGMFAWALFERRRAKKARNTQLSVPLSAQYAGHYAGGQKLPSSPSEMDSDPRQPVAELMGHDVR